MADANPFEQYRQKPANPFAEFAPAAGQGRPVTDRALLAKLNEPDIHIGAPDGSIVQFPAGTSDDTINGAMRKAYPKRVTDPALLAALESDAPAPMTLEQQRAVAMASARARAASADAAAPTAPAEPKGTLQTIREAIHAPTRALENGYFLGLGDRARAVINSGLEAVGGNGFNYSDNLKKEQGESEQFATAHPIAAPVVEGVGGVVAPLGVLGAVSKGASFGAKTLIGAGAGSGVGAGQGVLGSKDWTNLPQVGKDAAVGGGVGFGLGILLPGAAKVIGSGYEKVANALSGKVEGMSRDASGHLVNAVRADGPAAVQARMAELGPDAMLADAGPALLGKTQGASLNSDEGRSVLQSALTTRNVGTNARINNDVNRALGPAEDPQTVTNAITAHRSAVDNVNYPAALDNAPPVQTAALLRQIEGMIPQSVGNEQRALTNLRDMLMTTERRPLLDVAGNRQFDRLGNERWYEAPVSQNDAGVLHKIKGELDNVIQYDQPGLGVQAGALTRQQGALKHLRGQLNDALETQVPGYANANSVSAALANRAEAVNLGTSYLGSGKTTASPERFATAFDPLSQGEKIAFAKGSRGEIERNLGTKANDLQALRGQLQGEGGWNAAKIATVHGQAGADELAGTVDRNLAFRDTYNKVVENSQTAQRTAAAREMKPDPSSDTPLFGPASTLAGMGVTVAKKGLQGVVNALMHRDPTRSFGEVARALTEQGSARDARLLTIVDALGSRQKNAEAAPTAGGIGAVAAAILGNAALDSHVKARARK